MVAQGFESLGSSSLKHNTMNTTKLSVWAKEYLTGMRIIEVGDDYLVLDNGLRIYLDESEIESLN